MLLSSRVGRPFLWVMAKDLLDDPAILAASTFHSYMSRIKRWIRAFKKYSFDDSEVNKTLARYAKRLPIQGLFLFFEEFSKKFSRIFEEIWKNFSRNFEEFSKKFPRIFQEISKNFPRNFQEFSKKFPRILQEIWNKYVKTVIGILGYFFWGVFVGEL